jgi:hypothetical protein
MVDVQSGAFDPLRTSSEQVVIPELHREAISIAEVAYLTAQQPGTLH